MFMYVLVIYIIISVISLHKKEMVKKSKTRDVIVLEANDHGDLSRYNH